MAIKIRIGILSGCRSLASPTLILRAWAALARAQCQLITSSQSLPLHSVQGTPQRQGNSFRGLHCLLLGISVAVYLLFQLVVPYAGMMHICRLMDREVSASPGISAVHLLKPSGFLLGHPRHLRFIGIKGSQRLCGGASLDTLARSAPMPSAKSSHSSAWPSSPARFSATACISSPSSCGRDSNISR